MFRQMRDNFNLRLKNGVKWGVDAGLLFTGAVNGITALIVHSLGDPDDALSYIMPECLKYNCNCSEDEVQETDHSVHRDLNVHCPSQSNETYLRNLWTQRNDDNYATEKAGVNAYFTVHWAELVFPTLVISMGFGFLYGFCRNPLPPNDLHQPLIPNEILQGEHRINIPEKNKNSLAKTAPKEFIDPVSLDVMTNPVLPPCGHTMDLSTATECRNRHCPICREKYKLNELWVNHSLSDLIRGFIPTEPKANPESVALLAQESPKSLERKNEDVPADLEQEGLLSAEQKNESPSGETPPEYLDPITAGFMKNPVVIPCGHTLDKSNVDKCNGKCPHDSCGKEFDMKKNPLRNNWNLKSLIERYQQSLTQSTAIPAPVAAQPPLTSCLSTFKYASSSPRSLQVQVEDPKPKAELAMASLKG